MKKLIALILAMSLMIVSLTAVAETLNLEGITDGSAIINTEIDFPEKILDVGAKTTRTADKVYDKDDAVVIETSLGVVLTCTPPEGFACLTQDYFHDIEMYNLCVDNPLAMVEKFIEKEVHLNVFTTTGACVDTYFYVYSQTDSMDQVIGNANNLRDAEASYVADYLGKCNNVKFEYGMVGDQVWFIANLIDTDNLLVAFTWVNGHLVAAYMYGISSEADVVTALTELACVSFSEQ